MDEIKNYDFVIVGGNIMGMSLAIMLSQNSNFKIAIIEKNSLIKTISNKDYSSRLWALSEKSLKIIRNNRILSNANIKKIGREISKIYIFEDDDENAFLNFHPKDIGLKNFGYMIDEITIRNAIIENLIQISKNSKNLDLYFDYHINENIETNQTTKLPYGYTQIEIYPKENINQKLILKTNLIIGADGKNSIVRKLSHIKVKTKKYNQIAIVCDIKHEKKHNGTAIEKFTQSGPFAVLPKKDLYSSSIVWTEDYKVQKAIEKSSHELLESLIQNKIQENIIGKISLISKPSIFPLELKHAESYVSKNSRVVLVGDAAHSIHPIAGQGANLGFRDIELLKNLLLSGHNSIPQILKEYNNKRKLDSNLMIEFTSFINWSFKTKIQPIPFGRKNALKIMEAIPLLKKPFMLYASGLFFDF